mmetsp:Transcript_214/g.503  ORF Transcript_214/g.503 Transcript_214/m.503 type:complete len:424 (+) Transcript_214:295-1566(+)
MQHLVGCFLLLSSRLCAAVTDNKATSLSQKQMTAFALTRPPLYARRLHRRGTSQLLAESTKQTSSLFDLVKDVALGGNNDSGDIESVQDFDADLANEIEDALLSAGVGGSKDIIEDVMEEKVSETTKEMTGKTAWPPIQSKVSSYEVPPHTALAQVLANQLGIDLCTVSPSSSAPGRKITAEDVENHAWKISQPPCTSEALELAHSMGLNLNDLYDDEDREYVIELSDVQLYRENSRSLKMSSQSKKGVHSDLDADSRKQAKKMSALDKRMEKNMSKLSENAMKLAGTVTGGIIQQVQQAIGLNGSETLREGGAFVDMNSKSPDEIKTVEDFDADLASEIQEALSSAVSEDENDRDSAVARQISVGCTEKELQSMTCVHLKEHLRQRGLKVSGKKAELVDRLLESAENGSPLFFANLHLKCER